MKTFTNLDSIKGKKPEIENFQVNKIFTWGNHNLPTLKSMQINTFFKYKLKNAHSIFLSEIDVYFENPRNLVKWNP